MFGAEYNVRNHLEKLIKDNRVETLKESSSIEEDIQSKYRLKRGDN